MTNPLRLSKKEARQTATLQRKCMLFKTVKFFE